MSEGVQWRAHSVSRPTFFSWVTGVLAHPSAVSTFFLAGCCYSRSLALRSLFIKNIAFHLGLLASSHHASIAYRIPATPSTRNICTTNNTPIDGWMCVRLDVVVVVPWSHSTYMYILYMHKWALVVPHTNASKGNAIVELTSLSHSLANSLP